MLSTFVITVHFDIIKIFFLYTVQETYNFHRWNGKVIIEISPFLYKENKAEKFCYFLANFLSNSSNIPIILNSRVNLNWIKSLVLNSKKVTKYNDRSLKKVREYNCRNIASIIVKIHILVQIETYNKILFFINYYQFIHNYLFIFYIC